MHAIAGALHGLTEVEPYRQHRKGATAVSHRSGLRLATPAEVAGGYWDQCPYCREPVFLPIAGGKESKAWVACPSCAAAIQPEC